MVNLLSGRMMVEKELGGFFGLELPSFHNFPHAENKRRLDLNSGRGALEYFLKSKRPLSRLYVPRYQCPSVFSLLKRMGVSWEGYDTDEQLVPVNLPTLKEGEYFLYVNYFGVRESCSDRLAEHYGNRLILDHALALYSHPRAQAANIYSLRKFSGLPDGAFLIAEDALPVPDELDESLPEADFLLQCLVNGRRRSYELCVRNEIRLDQSSYRCMSVLTKLLMCSIDYESIARKRLDNFRYMHERLGSWNRFAIDLNSLSVPYCYPFRTIFPELRNELIDAGVLLPILWEDHLQNAAPYSTECILSQQLLPLPIDQRCSFDDLERMLRIIESYYAPMI